MTGAATGASDPGRRGDAEGGLPASLVLLAAGLFPLLAALRHLDDNSLASWAWTLAGRDVVGLWVLHLAVVAAAALLSRRGLPARWRPAAAVLAAFAAGVALSGEPEAVVDASRYFAQAKHLELFGPAAFLRDWGGAIGPWTDLPLPAFLYGVLFRWFGEVRFVAQLFTAGLFALTAYATARIGELLWSRETGACAALLLLAVPCLLVQVPLLMADVPAMAAVSVALWTLLAALERGGAARVAAAALALAAALLAKYSTWVLLAGTYAVILALEAVRRRPGALRRGAVVAAGGALAPALFALARPGLVGGQLALLSGFQWEGLRRWVESYPSTFLFQTHPLLAVAALAALWAGWRERDRGVLVAAVLPLVLFSLGARRTRYLLPAFPLIALLAARGLAALAARPRRFAALAAVGFSLVTVFAVDLPFLGWVNTANLRDAGRFLDERGVRTALVSVLPAPGVAINPEVAVPLLDYHTAARVLVEGDPPQPPTPEERRVSSFRFSWERPLPAWYRSGAAPPADAARVLITGDLGQPPPDGFLGGDPPRPPDAVFARDAVFRYRTFALVWLPSRDGR